MLSVYAFVKLDLILRYSDSIANFMPIKSIPAFTPCSHLLLRVQAGFQDSVPVEQLLNSLASTCTDGFLDSIPVEYLLNSLASTCTERILDSIPVEHFLNSLASTCTERFLDSIPVKYLLNSGFGFTGVDNRK